MVTISRLIPLLRALLWLCLLIVSPACVAELKPFTSDGCSVFPDGTLSEQKLWLACCTQHDFEYWKGGTYEQRLKSDQKLKSCVAEVGQPEVAAIMLLGVRVGGSPYLPTEFRWGYGWPYPREYKPLTPEEIAQVKLLAKDYIEQNQLEGIK